MPCKFYDATLPEELEKLRKMLATRRDLGLDTSNSSIESKVRSILTDVRQNGLDAVVRYTRDFDSPAFAPDMFRISSSKLAEAAAAITAEDTDIIMEAAENIRTFHMAQKDKAWFITRPDGTVLGQIFNPVQRAGLYVPGGQGGETPLISSLLMTAIPAQVAGVPEIAVITPPKADGSINTYIMAAAHLLGINEVYACGSAWGIGALVYGAGGLSPVDVVAGPGNIWVTTAKRLVIGQVGIDMIAGPSEIVIVADATAKPAVLAADMLGQAEHDALASSVCIVTDKDLINPLQQELNDQINSLPRAKLAKESLEKWGAVVFTPDMATAFDLVNEIAPEHLELICSHPMENLYRVKSAGAIFLGNGSAEALGDYFAGPNHVLPTMGTARFASGLGVQTFMKRSNIISASTEFAAKAAKSVARLARLEGLEAHARSAEARQ